jgi:hypothetical protein
MAMSVAESRQSSSSAITSAPKDEHQKTLTVRIEPPTLHANAKLAKKGTREPYTVYHSSRIQTLDHHDAYSRYGGRQHVFKVSWI